MRKFCFTFFFIALMTGMAHAQLTGTRDVPSADYPDIQSIADSLNLYGVGPDGISFSIAGDNTFEEMPLTFTATGSETGGVYIGWDGTGEKPVVNFSASPADGEAGFTLSGTDFYTIDGIRIVNSGSDLETAILITNQDDSNGAHNNTVKNVEIVLDKLNPNQTVGIAVQTQVDPTVLSGNNHNNKFYNNRLSDLWIGYSFDGGTSTTALMSTGNEVNIENGGESIIEDAVLAGVTARDQNGFTFSHTTVKDLTRIGDGSTAPAAIATSSGNPSDPMDYPFIISGNTIENLTSSFTSIFGMYLSARKATYNVSHNKIYNVTATGGGSNTADGIMIFGTDAVANIYNNMISGIAAPASAVNNNGATRGINIRSYGQVNAFYNSVLLDFTATNPAQISAAFVIYNNSDPVLLRNNIFVNKTGLAPDATGMAAAVYKRNNNFDNIQPGTDNNIYYAGTPDANHLIFYGHNSSSPNANQTLAEYQSAAGTFDQNAYSEDVPFVSAEDLHISASANTAARNNALPVETPVAVLDDFDGDMRDTQTPDIGADEISDPQLTLALAVNPSPADGETDVWTGLTDLGWEYTVGEGNVEPEAFFVYLGTDPDPATNEAVDTVMWTDDQNWFFADPNQSFEPSTTYYWQVVPVTAIVGGEAPSGVPVWSFTTGLYLYPIPAQNPSPEDGGTVELTDPASVTLSWDYIPDGEHILPDFFLIYASTNEDPQSETEPAGNIAFVEGQVSYSLELTNSSFLTYVPGENNYWKVLPVSSTYESYALNAPVWVFSFEEGSGVDRLSQNGGRVYPVPASDYVNIEPALKGTYSIQLFDVHGRMVKSVGSVTGTYRMMVSALPAGMYTLMVSQQGRRLSQLITVE